MSDQSPSAGPPVYGSAPAAPVAHGSAVVQPAGRGYAPAAAPPGSVPPGAVGTWGDYPPPPRKSRRTLWIVLGIVAVLLIGAGTAAAVWLVPAITGALEEQDATLRTPDTVAGLTKSTDATRQSTAEELKRQLEAEIPSSTSSMAAFYEDPADAKKVVMVYGVTAKISSPTKELDEAFSSAGTSMSVTDVRTVDAGPLSGEAKCGKGNTQGLDLTLCGWADHGSLALVVFFNRDVDSSAVMFKQIRNEVLVRN
ncbi:hypothetical protein [Luedemannella helvata]|uniref:Uncharacterized protein n=1 Tax=Luedemannella helvata TaxID=349315 RepID=A0ABP4WQH5_9ACTN